MNEIEKYLPIGSICVLKDGNKKLMVTGYVMINHKENDKMYDYCGCRYPEGIIDMSKNLLFNHDQIEEVFHVGYKDEEFDELNEEITEIINEEKEENNEEVSQDDKQKFIGEYQSLLNNVLLQVNGENVNE